LSNPLEFTGERFTPECIREISYEHVHRYVFAAELVRNKKVLDAACGEGYGSAHLARTAQSVSAVDISEEAISHARARYRSENLEYRVADCCQLPFEDNQFECIVSFETLEHLQDQSGLLREFRRVLEPAGFLLLSSPDKAVYTDRYHNENEFHVRELYRDELDALLAEQFPVRSLLRQKLLFYSAIWSQEAGSRFTLHQSGEDEVSARTDPGHEAMYYIAVCAADEAAYGCSMMRVNRFMSTISMKSAKTCRPGICWHPWSVNWSNCGLGWRRSHPPLRKPSRGGGG